MPTLRRHADGALHGVLRLFLDAQSLVRAALVEQLASVAPTSMAQRFTRLLTRLLDPK